MPETSSQGTGGRHEGMQETAPKAKTSESGVKGCVFVRPVAVASIFRPAAEVSGQTDNTKVPSVTERRRSSAFTSDLKTTSGSTTLLSSEEFARRRQSWDTRSTSLGRQCASRRDSKNLQSYERTLTENECSSDSASVNNQVQSTETSVTTEQHKQTTVVVKKKAASSNENETVSHPQNENSDVLPSSNTNSSVSSRVFANSLEPASKTNQTAQQKNECVKPVSRHNNNSSQIQLLDKTANLSASKKTQESSSHVTISSNIYDVENKINKSVDNYKTRTVSKSVSSQSENYNVKTTKTSEKTEKNSLNVSSFQRESQCVQIQKFVPVNTELKSELVSATAHKNNIQVAKDTEKLINCNSIDTFKKENISTSSNNEVTNIKSTDCNVKKKVYGLPKRNTSSNISQETLINQNTKTDKNKESENTTSESRKAESVKKVYGVVKPGVKSENKYDNIAKDVIKCSSESASSFVPVQQKSETSVNSSHTCSSEKDNIHNYNTSEDKASFQNEVISTFISEPEKPPRNVLTVRRTSGVIAAKIQDIFSNFSDNKSLPANKEKPVSSIRRSSEAATKTVSKDRVISTSSADSENCDILESSNTKEKTVISQRTAEVVKTKTAVKTPTVPVNNTDSVNNSGAAAYTTSGIAANKDLESVKTKTVVKTVSASVNSTDTVNNSRVTSNSISANTANKNVESVKTKTVVKTPFASVNSTDIVNSSRVASNNISSDTVNKNLESVKTKATVKTPASSLNNTDNGNNSRVTSNSISSIATNKDLESLKIKTIVKSSAASVNSIDTVSNSRATSNSTSGTTPNKELESVKKTVPKNLSKPADTYVLQTIYSTNEQVIKKGIKSSEILKSSVKENALPSVSVLDNSVEKKNINKDCFTQVNHDAEVTVTSDKKNDSRCNDSIVNSKNQNISININKSFPKAADPTAKSVEKSPKQKPVALSSESNQKNLAVENSTSAVAATKTTSTTSSASLNKQNYTSSKSTVVNIPKVQNITATEPKVASNTVVISKSEDVNVCKNKSHPKVVELKSKNIEQSSKEKISALSDKSDQKDLKIGNESSTLKTSVNITKHVNTTNSVLTNEQKLISSNNSVVNLPKVQDINITKANVVSLKTVEHKKLENSSLSCKDSSKPTSVTLNEKVSTNSESENSNLKMKDISSCSGNSPVPSDQNVLSTPSQNSLSSPPCNSVHVNQKLSTDKKVCPVSSTGEASSSKSSVAIKQSVELPASVSVSSSVQKIPTSSTVLNSSSSSHLLHQNSATQNVASYNKFSVEPALSSSVKELSSSYKSNQDIFRETLTQSMSAESLKLGSSLPEIPRPPERKRSAAGRSPALPPSVPLRSSITRASSLRRTEDPKLSFSVIRSPSHNSLPTHSSQRFSYTEMLSKLCSYGVAPSTSLTENERKYKSRSAIFSSSSSSQVSELWSDLTEEQSTSAHTAEMLESETAERMRLEKEVQQLQSRYTHAQQKSDKMEMEMMEARVYRTNEVNGDLSEEEDSETNSLYKQKYEKAVRDMEMMKRRIQQQHEEEMEQKLMLKKAADKKLAEALEDVEEERQVASQWKRKAQKLSSELQDLRLMLEEQMARNGELEKKQRRFDAELSACQEEIRKERLLREKLTREKEQALHEKYSLEQELQSTRLDMDMQHEKIAQLNRELDELSLSSKGEEEVTQLKRVKQELERKMRDQEEELEELAGQVQMLEQAKLRLEMSLEKLRQEHRREASVREEEIEEIRASSSKKIKNLEAQLELEQEERHQLVKQKHELERRIIELTDQPPAQDPEIERRLRRDLKRTKALLKDAQSMLEHVRDGQGNKTVIRQLKNQLEDAEFAKNAALKAKQTAEMELQDVQSQLEEATRIKNDAESRILQLSREKSNLQAQLEEMEEEMAEVMKKYKTAVAQMSVDQKTICEQNQQIADLEAEKLMLKDQLTEVNTKFEHLACQSDDAHRVHRLDSKVRDLESKLELEQTTRSRLEHQLSRLKEQNEKIQEECDTLRNKELQSQENSRRLQRQIRELREDYAAVQQKEAEANRKIHELETALESTEADLQLTKNDLRLACQRIQDLQNALEDDLDSGTDVPDDSGSDSDSSLDVSSHLRHSLASLQRHDSISSNLSMCSDGRRSRTPSFVTDASLMGRMMWRQTSMDFLI